MHASAGNVAGRHKCFLCLTCAGHVIVCLTEKKIISFGKVTRSCQRISAQLDVQTPLQQSWDATYNFMSKFKDTCWNILQLTGNNK